MIVFEYRLTEVGSSELDIDVNGEKWYVSASYLSDGLSDFLKALIEINKSDIGKSKEFKWEEDQYSTKFILIKKSKTEIELLISTYKVICDVEELNRAVFKNMSDILKTYGEEGYKKMWVLYDFPMREYEELKKLLNLK